MHKSIFKNFYTKCYLIHLYNKSATELTFIWLCRKFKKLYFLVHIYLTYECIFINKIRHHIVNNSFMYTYKHAFVYTMKEIRLYMLK